MRNIIYLTTIFVLIFVLAFAFSSCGSGSDEAFSVVSRDPIDLGTVSKNDNYNADTNTNTNSGNADGISSNNSQITVSMPDFNHGTGIEEKAVFTKAESGNYAEFKIYHLDDVIKSITMTVTTEFPDYSKDQMTQLVKDTDNQFAAFAKNSFVSYSCTASGNKATIVIAMRNLDEGDNQKIVADAKLMPNFTANDTYSQFKANLQGGGFNESK